MRFAKNMCPSQGSMDIFVEPVLPRPQIVVCGASPVAVAIADLGRRIGFDVTVCAPPADQAAFGEDEGTDGEGYRCLSPNLVHASSSFRPRAATRRHCKRHSRWMPSTWRLSAAGRRPRRSRRCSPNTVSRRSAWQGSRHRPASTSATAAGDCRFDHRRDCGRAARQTTERHARDTSAVSLTARGHAQVGRTRPPICAFMTQLFHPLCPRRRAPARPGR